MASRGNIIRPGEIAQPVEDDRPDRQAIERICAQPGRLRAVYQPIVDLTSGRIIGFEALARFTRWKPGDWFREAARLGLAGSLEAAVIHSVLEQRDNIPEGRFLAINVTPFGVLDANVQEALTSYGALDGIVIEISEQMRVVNCAAIAGALADARDLGAHIAIDAAGENSSLDQILALAPEIVKIGRPIIAGVDFDRYRAAVVESVSLLADRVGARAVAEGIETEEQLEVVIDLGAHLGQGFAFGHGLPMMSDRPLRLEELIRSRASGRRAA